jgi:hypothetical protein
MALEREVKASGRTSALFGAAHTVGLTINPTEILPFLHDCVKNAPIPYDAVLRAIGIEDKGADSAIEFHFESAINPLENCLKIDPHYLIRLFMQFSNGMIPSDTELRGIEISDRFNLLMFVLRSDKFPTSTTGRLPIAGMRYQAGVVKLYPAENVVLPNREHNIVLTDKR